MNKKNYLFDIDTVALYLNFIKPDISPLKLHKSLYFLFAYYGATYGQKSSESISEGNSQYPLYLFNGEFEAWKSGSVNREIYEKTNNNQLFDKDLINLSVNKIEEYPEIKLFIDDLFKEIDSVSDFTLMERNKQDEVWKEFYSKEKINILDNIKIIEEYIQRYL